MVLSLAVEIVIVALAAWFWRDCARPALIARRASSLAYGLVLGVTVLTIVVHALVIAAEIAGIGGGAAQWWITLIVAALWISVVGLGYLQGYALLLRVTGRSHPSRQQ